MGDIETDYLVVGAGATGMAFVDALLAKTDARVVLVDRRHAPGGHWLDAYPFVRLHQPSANYGVASERLGHDAVDAAGPNAGFYERATAAEICDYFRGVLETTFIPSGQVQFLGMSDFRGEETDGHCVTSLLTGARTTVSARVLVDATYVQSEIPSRHALPYDVEPGVRVVAPNDLVNLDEPPRGFTVVGAGKTAMDTCNWLLDTGVDPDRIVWIRPRESWMFDRRTMQPLEEVAAYMQMQASWVEAAATAADGPGFAHLLEEAGVFVRIAPDVEPEMFRGATISMREVEQLRTIERVVRRGHVRVIGRDRVVLDGGDLPGDADRVYVDCTARGVPTPERRPVFEPGRITMQYVTIGIVPWSAATIGTVEASRDDIEDKNRLCPPLTFTGDVADLLWMAHSGMTGLITRGSEPDLAAWNEDCRLNPAAGAMARFAEPDIAVAVTSMAEHIGPAMRNLAERTVQAAVPAQQPRSPRLTSQT